MERLAQWMGQALSSRLKYSDEQRAVITYGLIIFIQFFTAVIAIILTNLLFHTVIEGLLLLLTASLYRQYSGGAHAGNIVTCTIISVFLCTFIPVSFHYLFPSGVKASVLCGVIIVTFSLAYLVVYRLAPVDSPNKPIKTELKRKRMRKYSFIIVSVIAGFSLFLFCLSLTNLFIFLSNWIICICFAILCQSFTLTPPAKFLFSLIDFHPTQLKSRERRVTK